MIQQAEQSQIKLKILRFVYLIRLFSSGFQPGRIIFLFRQIAQIQKIG